MLDRAYVQADALDIAVVVLHGVLAAGNRVADDGAAVVDLVALPKHLDALAVVLEPLRLRVHGPAAGCRPALAPAPHCFASSANVLKRVLLLAHSSTRHIWR